MKKYMDKKIIVLILTGLLLQSCFFTKIITVPMRAGAAVVSIVPVVGNNAHDIIDEAAETVDEIPF